MEQMTFSFMGEESTCSSAERHVRDSARQVGKADSTTTEAPSLSPIFNYLKDCAPNGSFGKTYRVYLTQMAETTSSDSSMKLLNSGIAVRGVCLTRNTSESTVTLAPFLNEDGVCSLSDILQENGSIPQKYFLSKNKILSRCKIWELKTARNCKFLWEHLK